MEESWRWLIAVFGVLAVSVILRDRFFRSSKNSELKMTLISKRVITDNTAVYRFSAPVDFRLPIGQHVVISRSVGDQRVSRPYTPIAVGNGWIELLIKIYRPTDRFPQGGVLSQYIDNLEIGSVVDARGPVGRMEYLGKGSFRFGGIEKNFTKIGMIAGGTGITPMYQIIQAAESEVELSLLFANQTPTDILLREELGRLKSISKLTLTVDRISDDLWKGSVGFIDEAKIKMSLPPPAPDVIVLICGPPPMTSLCRSLLSNLGYSEIFTF